MDQKTSPFSNEITRLILVSGVIAGLVLITYLVFRKNPEPTAPTNRSTVHVAAVTPQAYTMISGKVVEVRPTAKTIDVDFSTVEDSGKNTTKRYTVSINDATTLQTVNQQVNPVTTTSMRLTDLQIGDLVDAIGDQNLADVETFTATTIIRLQP